MSRQRPYGTFEEAYILQMLNRIPEIFDEFVLIMIKYRNLLNKIGGIEEIRLPFMFCDKPLIKEYWYGLCRMFGEIGVYEENNYILVENINLCVDHIIYLIRNAFPPAWELDDDPILSLYDVNFI